MEAREKTSKQNREKRHQKKVTPFDTRQTILQSLRTDFFLVEEEVDLIDNALDGRAPHDIVEHMIAIHAGNVPLPLRREKLHIDMEDGTFQTISLTDNPINLLYDYLIERYEEPFAVLYWSALVPSSEGERDFLKFLEMMKHVPAYQDNLQALKNRANITQTSEESEGGDE